VLLWLVLSFGGSGFLKLKIKNEMFFEKG